MKHIFTAPLVLSRAAVLAAVASLLAVAPAQGAVVTWDGELLSNDWDAGPVVTNWDGMGVIAGSTDDVVFPDTAFDFDVNLNGDREVISVTFSGASGYTIDDSSAQQTLTISSGDITVSGGATHTFGSNADIALGANGVWDIMGSSTNLVANGNISGNFSLFQIGLGTLTLTGANTYTGATGVIGTVQIGNGGTTGSITGDVAIFIGGVLAFNRSNDLTYGGAIDGLGSLTKQGAGTLTLTAANTYSGGTTINGGTLSLGNSDAAGSGTITVLG